MNGSAILISPLADRDIDEHFAYIVEDSLDAAVRFFDATHETFEDLLAMPQIGRVYQFKNTELSGIRAWPVKGFPKYLIFYRPTQEGIVIVRLLHGAQDIESIFSEEGESE